MQSAEWHKVSLITFVIVTLVHTVQTSSYTGVVLHKHLSNLRLIYRMSAPPLFKVTLSAAALTAQITYTSM